MGLPAAHPLSRVRLLWRPARQRSRRAARIGHRALGAPWNRRSRNTPGRRAFHAVTIKSFSASERCAIDGNLIEEIARAEKLEFQTGDILLLRTGWLAWYKLLDQEACEKLRGTLHPDPGGLRCAGLDPAQATAAWLWDHRIAAIAADNPAVEALPVDPGVGFQHRRLIALQGMPLGELWDLDELANQCAADGVYEFMLVSAPLYIPGGVGSPANAYAMR
jgi:kynurenine formamidase